MITCIINIVLSIAAVLLNFHSLLTSKNRRWLAINLIGMVAGCYTIGMYLICFTVDKKLSNFLVDPSESLITFLLGAVVAFSILIIPPKEGHK